MIKVINSSDPDKFEKQVNDLIAEGYKVISANTGFVNSERYDFCGVYDAVLEKVEVEELQHRIMTVEESDDTWINRWISEHSEKIRNVKVTATPIYGQWKPEWNPYVAFFYTIEYDQVIKKEV